MASQTKTHISQRTRSCCPACRCLTPSQNIPVTPWKEGSFFGVQRRDANATEAAEPLQLHTRAKAKQPSLASAILDKARPRAEGSSLPLPAVHPHFLICAVGSRAQPPPREAPPAASPAQPRPPSAQSVSQPARPGDSAAARRRHPARTAAAGSGPPFPSAPSRPPSRQPASPSWAGRPRHRLPPHSPPPTPTAGLALTARSRAKGKDRLL